MIISFSAAYSLVFNCIIFNGTSFIDLKFIAIDNSTSTTKQSVCKTCSQGTTILDYTHSVSCINNSHIGDNQYSINIQIIEESRKSIWIIITITWNGNMRFGWKSVVLNHQTN